MIRDVNVCVCAGIECMRDTTLLLQIDKCEAIEVVDVLGDDEFKR